MKLKPKNWDQFQHYNKRTPPWIKLHRGLLDDFDYQRLPVASRALAPMLWLLASEGQDGEFDASLDYLTFRLRCSQKEITDGLKPLIDGGFFSVASGALSDRYQTAIPEVEAELEKEVEVEKSQINGANAPVESAEKHGPCHERRNPPLTTMAEDVFNHWREVMGHPKAKFSASDDRSKKVIKQLKAGYSVDELKLAVDGCAKTPHNMGDNDRGQRYDGLNVICKNGDNVDRFIRTASNPDLTHMSSAARKTLTAAQRWIENEQ